MDLLIKYQLTNYVIIVFTINAPLISKLPNQKAISIMQWIQRIQWWSEKLMKNDSKKKKKKPL